MFGLDITALLGIFFCGLILLLALGGTTFWILLQLGVIAAKAAEPPVQDHGNYSLQQGQEVRAEHDDQSSR